ncbi:RNA-binding motif protein, X chromosome-like isoform X1 [Pan troglodytes]|uniref:RNA-binding motif protein, X chromosome-like isoform X1 n=1 Tax=Pan troglodytes TaxID=9598 RepID=UPI0030135643
MATGMGQQLLGPEQVSTAQARARRVRGASERPAEGAREPRAARGRARAGPDAQLSAARTQRARGQTPQLRRQATRAGPSSSPGAGRAPGSMASPSGRSEATGKTRGRDGRPRREEDDVPPEEKRLRLLLEGEAHSPRTARTGRTRRGQAERRPGPRQVATADLQVYPAAPERQRPARRGHDDDGGFVQTKREICREKKERSDCYCVYIESEDIRDSILKKTCTLNNCFAEMLLICSFAAATLPQPLRPNLELTKTCVV